MMMIARIHIDLMIPVMIVMRMIMLRITVVIEIE